MPKTFLLGVGAHKGGTTWLHDYLKGRPDTDMGFLKEYHVFDALFIDEAVIRRKFLQQRIKDIVSPTRWPRLDQLRLLRFLGNPEHYFDYFQRLCRDPRVKLTGDITPSYSGLPIEAFGYIKQQLEQRGFDVKVLLLMRDPVERCLSATRMWMRHSRIERTAESEAARLAVFHQLPGYRLRTRYDLTIANLEAVFRPEQIFYGFYEELFDQASVRALCRFLGLPYLEPDLAKRVNESRTDHVLPDALRAEVAQAYAMVYRAVGERFGQARVAALWPNQRFVR